MLPTLCDLLELHLINTQILVIFGPECDSVQYWPYADLINAWRILDGSYNMGHMIWRWPGLRKGNLMTYE